MDKVKQLEKEIAELKRTLSKASNQQKPNKVKKKSDFFKKLKSSLVKLITFIKLKIFAKLTIWYQKNKQIRLDKKMAKEVKRNFKKDFGVSSEAIVKAMQRQKSFSGTAIQQTDNNYLGSKLIEARKYLNEGTCNKAPLFYNPEICDIHNENQFRLTSETIEEIRRNDAELAKKILDNIKDTRKEKLANRAKYLWRTRM